MRFPDCGCVYCGFHRLEAERDALIRDRWAEGAQVNTSPIVAGLTADNARLRAELTKAADSLDWADAHLEDAGVVLALSALPAVQPRVKPLVWIEDGDGFCAKGATRTYAVFRLALDNSTWGAVGVEHTSRDKASVMAACQSDHDAQILAALYPAVQPDLTDPNVVHANMLRGTIARPTVDQIRHIYGSELTALHALAPDWPTQIDDILSNFAGRQRRLGAEFERALAEDIEKLYEGGPVQPDAAAIREEALLEACRAVKLNAWTHLGKDDYSQGMAAGARCQSEADCRAIRALIDNNRKEVKSE
jgi:hypothetical protein